ncbi:3-deoxy-D-manno-octulosonic acid kinase [Vibrio kyushuensis]|uniref:3-deoxy-D-manno-octulosonic acid kinase n=1 Tax=Vibrio kyushuensis TaxID=2910249 RepID=UPI003D14CE6C
MFTIKQIHNTTYWYDPSQLSEDVELAFCIDYWKDENAILGSAKGRGTTWFVQGKIEALALRHYHRGGLFGKIVKDSYLFTGLTRTRAYQELTLLEKLISNNVNVPKPIAAKVTKTSSLSYSADILTQKISNAKDLVKILSSQSLSKASLHSIGVEIRKMHDAEVNHTDLNIHNIMIDDKDKVWIIDFDKCCQQAGNKWKEGNLSRLERSFDKEVELGNIDITHFCFEEIKKGYSNSTLDK